MYILLQTSFLQRFVSGGDEFLAVIIEILRTASADDLHLRTEVRATIGIIFQSGGREINTVCYDARFGTGKIKMPWIRRIINCLQRFPARNLTL